MMHAPTTEFNHPARIAAGVNQLLADEAERWGRARFMACVVSLSGADLDDDADVARALFAARYSRADFDEELDDVISEARAMQEGK